MKEAVRRIYYALCWIGLASPEVYAKTGTLKHKFYDWLYGNGEPEFYWQMPDKEGN